MGPEKRREIAPLDETAMEQARRRWAGVAKPLHSLGMLEEIVIRMAGMQRTADVACAPACVTVFCADNGVVEEGVTQTGQEVTRSVADSIAAGRSNVNLMAAAVGARVLAVDIGMAAPGSHPELLNMPISRGTANIAKGPAMTRSRALDAIETGVALAKRCQREGVRVLLPGEMGIGNTTTSAAVLCALLGEPAQVLVGRGAGLSDEGLARKRAAVAQALAVNRPNAGDPIDVLSKVGGLDLAGMAGVFLGGALCGMPVIIDGVIAATAALLAARMEPLAARYMLASHASREPGGVRALRELGLTPIVHANMALGEGTGALTLLPMIDMALRVYRGGHTFDALGMKAYEEMTPCSH